MHLIKNNNGNIVIYQSPSLKNCWGHIDEYGDYIGERDASKSQIFHLYDNAISIQEEVLIYLEAHKHRNVMIRVKNYEKEAFWAICPVKEFRNKAKEWEKNTGKPAIFNYDKLNYARYGRQIRLPMNYWTRKYDGQEELNWQN